MDADKFQESLEDLLKKIGAETAYIDGEEGQLGRTLRALLPIDDRGNKVLTEIILMPYTEETDLLGIYTTMVLEIGLGYEALKDMILDWNLTCKIGAFGIYRQGLQLYHKYTYPVPMEVPPDEMALEVFYLINLIQDAIAEHYEDALHLSGYQ